MKTRTSSSSVHGRKPRVRFSRLSRSKEFSRKSFLAARRTILTVIVLAMLTVILTVLLVNFSNPERIVKSKIEAIATDYYENYYDPADYTTSDKSAAELLSLYENTGLRAPLRQLLLFDNRRHADSAAILREYCDESETYVKFYPYAPYGKTDYRVEYFYSCIF